MSDWNFGGAFADTAETVQRTQQAQQAFPLDQAHKQATTDYLKAETGLLQNKLHSEQRMAEIMQGMKLGEGGESQSTSLMQMAGAAMKAGDPTTAQTLILRATQAQTQESRKAHDDATAATAKANLQIKMADRYAQLMGSVHSQQDFDRANFLFQAEFGEKAPAMQYDPGAVEMLRQSSIKMSDKIRMDHDQAMEKLRKASLDETRAYHGESIKIRKEAEARREAADRTRAKAGGKDVGAPSKNEVDAARDLIDRESKGKGMDATTSRSAAFDLASRARAMRRQNPGLDAGEAQQRAYVEQIAEGYYATKRATRVEKVFGGKDSVTYGKPGGSSERALAVPADRSTLKSDTYYKTPKGNLLYLGNGKWQAPQADSSGASGSDEEDDSGDEEE